ncbi:hypothetical protein KKC22_08595 [Myxococcota bacterium]|nr:hypothetical protein [Myxococcota bacterium]
MTSSDLTRTLDRIRNCTDPVFFVGTHKNSGKTTAFMRIAQALREENVPLILCSIGRDGEALDQFFGHRKPPVRVEPGWRFVTAGAATADVPCELISPLPAFVDGRQLGLFEARACGDVELWGPPVAADLRRTLDACARFELDGRRPVLLVDGALDRQAALYHGPAGMILCCKAGAFPSPDAFGAWLAARRRLFLAPLHLGSLPTTRLTDGDDLPQSLTPDEVLVDGPLSQTLAMDLLARGDSLVRIVVTSPMHVFVDHATLDRLVPKLALLSAPDWFATAINPAPNGGAAPDPGPTLAAARRALGPDHPVFDVLMS